MTPENWSGDNECPKRGRDGPKGDTVRKSRFTETQIAGHLQEHAAGGSTIELCRRIGVTSQTLYRWKKQYGGMTSAELARLKTLEAENARLKRLVADQALDNVMLKDLLSKKW